MCEHSQPTSVNIHNQQKLDGNLPANPVKDRRVANAVTLKSTFRLPQNQQLFKNT